MEPNTPKPKKSSSTLAVPVKTQLFGIGITNDTEINILEYIVNSLNKSQENFYIVTPNPEIIVFSQKNFHFRKILNEAKIALCDGMGLWWASKILGKPLQSRVTGVDLMEKLCKRIADQPITVGFLGGRHGVAESTAECLRGKYPGLKVVFASDEWKSKGEITKRKWDVRGGKLENEVRGERLEEKSQRFDLKIQPPNSKLKIHTCLPAGRLLTSNFPPQIDILFVAFGFPKQEEWMREHLNKIPVRIMMGVGGAFDYISGKVPRAPRLLRTLGLEWLYRLTREPWRWKRQIALIEFIYLVFKEKLAKLSRIPLEPETK